MVQTAGSQGNLRIMRHLLLVLSILLLSSCNTIRRFTSSESTPPDAIPDVIKLTGVTVVDYQVISVRCADSAVTVRVKWKDGWHECNPFEVHIDTVGAGGGGVWFRRICYPTYDSTGKLIQLYITSDPVAPKGTEYEITSVALKGTVHELY